MPVSDHPTITAAIAEGRRRRMAMSVAEAAIEANIGRDGIYEAIREGRLEARKWGRRTLITHEALQRFLNGLPPLQLPPAA
jgi:excisionase family DNA binding protein